MAEKEEVVKETESIDADDAREEDSRAEKIANRVLTVLILLLACFVTYVMVCSAQGKAVKIFGKSVLKVVTGSMEPSIHVDDFIKVESVPQDKLRVGDIVTFYSEQEDIRGVLVTHRIKAINADGTFITRGDANDADDRLPVRYDQLVGRYIGKARFFTWVNSFASVRKILMLLVIIPMTLAAFYEVKTVAKITAEMREQPLTKEERKAQLIREAIEKEKERLAREHYGENTHEPEGSSAEVKADEPGKGDEAENGRSDHSV